MAFDLANDWNYVLTYDEENDEEIFAYGYMSDESETNEMEEEEIKESL